jgi:hypothetical protein
MLLESDADVLLTTHHIHMLRTLTGYKEFPKWLGGRYFEGICFLSFIFPSFLLCLFVLFFRKGVILLAEGYKRFRPLKHECKSYRMFI